MSGAVAGGVAVYQALRQVQPASLAVPTQAVEAIPASSQQQALVVNTTEDETHSYINTLFQYKPGDQVSI